MSNQQFKLFQQQDSIEFTATTKLICKSQNVTPHNSKPQKRYGHLSFIYKSKLYVIGGCPVDNKNQPITSNDLKSFIYCYSLQKQRASHVEQKKVKKMPESTDVKWQVIQAKFTPQAEAQFSLLSYSAHCIFPHKKRLYLFGGSTPQGKTSGHLFRLDLDSLQWSKPQQKGTTPKPREQAFLSLYTKNQKNCLVLYGGANYETHQILSDINFYQIETKYWFQCHNLSINFIQPRISPGVCFNENKIYIFGGYYLDAKHNKGYFNDLYEIEFNLSVQKGRPYGRSFVKRLDQIASYKCNENIKPEPRCSTSLMLYKHDFSLQNQQKKYSKFDPHCLLLIGGQKSCDQKKRLTNTLNDIWIFSLTELKWRNIMISNDFKSRASFSSVFDKEINKIFIFGGLSSLQTMLNDFVCLKIVSKANSNQQEQIKTQKNQNEQQIPYIGEPISDYLISQICSTITFPYSSFSLIIDNFVNFQAQFCDVFYHISKSKNLSHNYIKFQSNAVFTLSKDALMSHFTCIKGGIRTYVQGTDKKIKAQMNKDNLVKQIGSNFVLGGLRLGSQLIFINLNHETYEIQIIIVLKCQNNFFNNQSSQKFKVFSFVILREQIFNQDVLAYQKNNRQAKKRKYFFEHICPQQSRQRIRTLIVQGINLIKKGLVKNIFYISKLRTIQGQECTSATHENSLQLFPDMLLNDLIYGDRQVIKQIYQTTAIPIYQCMDISLRTFISYLYTQHCQTQITLSIQGLSQGLQRKQVMMQDYLLKFDQLLKNKNIEDISNEFQFDCKIIQLYHFNNNQEENKNSFTSSKLYDKFFAHGTLYYHKTRLIKRHPIELGQFLLQYQLRKILQKQKPQKSVILKSSSHYSASEVFGHIELPQAVPVNLTKTNFVFPVMLQKIDQRLRVLQDQIVRQKRKKRNSYKIQNGNNHL